jgi:hypothetical protein
LFGTGVVVWWNRQRLLAAPPAGRDVLKGFVKLD